MNDCRRFAAALGASLALVFAPALRLAAQAQPVQAGVAAAVRGSVRVADRPGSVGRDLASGMPVYLGNEITTGPSAGLQIMLLDETVFTIGPDSRLRVDEFVYDASGGDGRLSATISKGVFRFVSGRIAQKRPENMKVDLPSGTIGIRGTSAMGSTDGTSASVVLLGPGATNNAGERPGRVEVSNAAGRVELRAPLFGTTIGAPGSAPSPAALWTPARLEALTVALTVAPAPAKGGDKPAGPAGGESARSGEQAGEGNGSEPPPGPEGSEEPAPTGEQTAGAEDVTPRKPDGNPDGESGPLPPPPGGAEIGMAGLSPTELAGQGSANTIQTVQIAPLDLPPALPPPSDLPPSPGVPMLSELTTFDQLRSLTTGFAVYESLSVPLQGAGVGFYSINFKIDLAAQKVRLDRFDGGYQFNGQSPMWFNDMEVGTDVFDYAGATGLANNFSDPAEPGGGSRVLPNGDEIKDFVEILNSGSVIGGQARTRVVIVNGQTGAELSGGAVAQQKLIPQLPANTTAESASPSAAGAP